MDNIKLLIENKENELQTLKHQRFVSNDSEHIVFLNISIGELCFEIVNIKSRYSL